MIFRISEDPKSIMDAVRDVAEFEGYEWGGIKEIGTATFIVENDEGEIKGKVVEFEWDAIRHAIFDIVSQRVKVNERIRMDIVSGVTFDVGDLDAEAVDVILQVALFGEIVNG